MKLKSAVFQLIALLFIIVSVVACATVETPAEPAEGSANVQTTDGEVEVETSIDDDGLVSASVSTEGTDGDVAVDTEVGSDGSIVASVSTEDDVSAETTIGDDGSIVASVSTDETEENVSAETTISDNGNITASVSAGENLVETAVSADGKVSLAIDSNTVEFPVMDDASAFVTEATYMDNVALVYESAYTVEEIIAFHRAEMPTNGFQFVIEATTNAVVPASVLYFLGSDVFGAQVGIVHNPATMRQLVAVLIVADEASLQLLLEGDDPLGDVLAQLGIESGVAEVIDVGSEDSADTNDTITPIVNAPPIPAVCQAITNYTLYWVDEAGNLLINGENAGAFDGIINGGGGNDVMLLPPTTGRNTANGGDGNDCLVGNEGADILNGNNGDDILVGNAGSDIANGNDGNDVCEAEVENQCETNPGGSSADTPPPPTNDDASDNTGNDGNSGDNNSGNNGGGQAQSITYADDLLTLTYQCQGEAITISGNTNTITLKGHCASVTITGDFNTILIGTTGPLTVSGNLNTVSYDSAGSVSNTGSNNTISSY